MALCITNLPLIRFLLTLSPTKRPLREKKPPFIGPSRPMPWPYPTFRATRRLRAIWRDACAHKFDGVEEPSPHYYHQS